MATNVAYLHALVRERQEEEEGVAEADLRQRVLECPVGPWRLERAKEDPEEDQYDAAPHGVGEHVAEPLALGASAGDRERQRCAGEKRERWLNQIVQRTTLPRHVASY